MHSVRSFAVLGVAFTAVVVATLGLAAAIVPVPTLAPGPTIDGSGRIVTPAPGTPQPAVAGRRSIGGTLVVTGDREGSFALTGELIENRYALTGDGGRISFQGQPVNVVQLSYDGLEFFPEPEDCDVTPRDLDEVTGTGRADLVCTDLQDVRGNGTISLSGEIGLPIDLLAERTLPHTGGNLRVGPETWTFEDLFVLAWEMPDEGQHNLELVDRVATASGTEQPARLMVDYDIQTHVLSAAAVERGGELVEIPDGACAVEREELGMQNPRTTVSELVITCPALDVPGLGPVPVHGTVVVDELAWPAGASG